jgi:hypothetical protein
MPQQFKQRQPQIIRSLAGIRVQGIAVVYPTLGRQTDFDVRVAYVKKKERSLLRVHSEAEEGA